MKIIIVRHGEPDYSIDSLTSKGWREAEYLAERLAQIPVKAYYTSPLGRAMDTAAPTLQRVGRTAEILPWLREFDAMVYKPNVPQKETTIWDWLPQDWTADERFFCHDQWWQNPVMEAGEAKQKFAQVTGQLDELLATHGYERQGYYYHAAEASNDTIVLFCHFAVSCVILSHLLNVSPMILWHGFCAAPSSVTTVVTEERREGIACWRVLAFGDTSHLYHHGEPPSFMARFCECYQNENERRDVVGE